MQHGCTESTGTGLAEALGWRDTDIEEASVLQHSMHSMNSMHSTAQRSAAHLEQQGQEHG